MRLCFKCKKPVIDVDFGEEKFAVCTNKDCPRFGLMSLVAYENDIMGLSDEEKS